MRKIIQLVAIPAQDYDTKYHRSMIFGLCDDGATYQMILGRDKQDCWIKLPSLPEENVKSQNEGNSNGR